MRILCLAVLVLVAVGLFLALAGINQAGSSEKNLPTTAAIERARAEVQMLDDLYKNFVVHITATYVGAEENVPAAKVAMKVFQAMDKKGWHKVRLVDATGRPVRKANLPRTSFERTAVSKLQGGKTYYEEIDSGHGRPVFRAATVVPVVMKQCITCHEGRKEGDLLGAIVYEIPIK